eukprot:m51a1_g3197 hypothetical protein (257) ;mRNA; r:451375-452545
MAEEEVHEFGVSPAELPRLVGPHEGSGPYLWVSTENAFRGSAFAVGVVAPASWMRRHNVEPQHIRNAGATAYAVLRGSPLDQLEVGCTMYESYGQSAPADPAGEPCREFVFESAKTHCTSSRLHLGGKIELVFELRGPHDNVVARIRSVQAAEACAAQRPQHTGMAVDMPELPVRHQAGRQQSARSGPYDRESEHASDEDAAVADTTRGGEQERLMQQLLELQQLQDAQMVRVRILEQLLLHVASSSDGGPRPSGP